MKIIKCQFRYWELCWILEALDDLLHDNIFASRNTEINRVREHVVRLIKKMEVNK